MSTFKIDKEKDFTKPKLVEFLNDKFPNGKKTGSPFTLGDIQQYLRRGHLPRPYGFHPIEHIKIEETGISLIRVNFDKTVK